MITKIELNENEIRTAIERYMLEVHKMVVAKVEIQKHEAINDLNGGKTIVVMAVVTQRG